MLTTEMRQSLTGLMIHPNIYSVEVRDFRYPDGTLKSNVTIHTVEDANREEILHILCNTVGIRPTPKGNYRGQDGKRVFPYNLVIEGTHPGMSTIFFTETVGKQQWTTIEDEKKPSLPQESLGKNTLLNGITEWTIEEVMRREG